MMRPVSVWVWPLCSCCLPPGWIALELSDSACAQKARCVSECMHVIEWCVLCVVCVCVCVCVCVWREKKREREIDRQAASETQTKRAAGQARQREQRPKEEQGKEQPNKHTEGYRIRPVGTLFHLLLTQVCQPSTLNPHRSTFNPHRSPPSAEKPSCCPGPRPPPSSQPARWMRNTPKLDDVAIGICRHTVSASNVVFRVAFVAVVLSLLLVSLGDTKLLSRLLSLSLARSTKSDWSKLALRFLAWPASVSAPKEEEGREDICPPECPSQAPACPRVEHAWPSNTAMRSNGELSNSLRS